jgi:hypothetical protein
VKCTWVNCEDKAKNLTTTSDGKVYINLCDKHADWLNAAYWGASPGRLAKILRTAEGLPEENV